MQTILTAWAGIWVRRPSQMGMSAFLLFAAYSFVPCWAREALFAVIQPDFWEASCTGNPP